jgi:hypothetical protein
MGRPEDPPEHAPFWHVIRNGMLDVEPPDHTRLRRLVSRAFTPRTVERLRGTVQEVTDRLVDDALEQGTFDLMATVAEPLPVTVIAEMLGVPAADRHLLRPWSADICGMYELDPSEQTAARAVRACQEFGDYLVELGRERRARPQDDLVTALVQVVDQGDVLTEDELVGTCVLLLNAGHEATVNVTGNGWWALFRRPEQLARLRADPSLLAPAVEELMRWDTPLQVFERWVLEDLEIGGVPVPRGAELGLLFGSANRDPAASPTRTPSTSAATRTRTCPSGPACTSASARRSRGSSCRRRSGRSCAGCPPSSWSRSRPGARATSSAACRSCGSGSEEPTRRPAAVEPVAACVRPLPSAVSRSPVSPSSSAGVVFPRGEDGRRSTTATGRAVWADAVRDVDPGLAARIDAARDWRTAYVRDVVDVTAAGTTSPGTALSVARAGLASLAARMRFEQEGSAVPVAEAVAQAAGPPLGTSRTTGQRERVTELVVPYHGRALRGDALLRQLDDWVATGTIEPSCAQALRRVVATPRGSTCATARSPCSAPRPSSVR